MPSEARLSVPVFITSMWSGLSSEVAKASQERDNLGMLVWFPNQNLAEAKRKFSRVCICHRFVIVLSSVHI